MKRILACIACVVWLQSASAQSNTIAEKLDEAEDYLTVNPARTLSLLRSITELDTVPQSEQLRWHLLLLRAAVPTNQIDELFPSFELLFKNTETTFFLENSTSILSGLGIWLRRNKYFQEAQTTLECASRLTHEPRQKLTLLNSIALVARQRSDYEQANRIYSQAIRLAEEQSFTNVAAMIHNNIGLLALEQGNFEKAKIQLRQSLEQYQAIDKRSGIISASINLLYVAILQEDLIDFERLYDRTQALTEAFPNHAKKALIYWLKVRYDQLNNKPITDFHRQRLLFAYDNLADDKIRLSVYHYLAPKMNVSVQAPPPQETQTFEASWFNDVLSANGNLTAIAPLLLHVKMME